MGKLFEIILNERIKKDLEEKDILSNNQYGLSKRGDCRNRRMCILTTLDIKNAFNSANWIRVIRALEKKGISQPMIRIMKAYLSDREIKGEKFDRNMSAGVPQGSILGPTLWNILYDDVLRLEVQEGVTLIAYADDLAIISLARNEEEMEFKLNFTLEEINKWMKENKLHVAPDKSQAIVIGGRKKYGQVNIILGGENINIENKLKYLGVVIDNKLSFLPQITKHVC